MLTTALIFFFFLYAISVTLITEQVYGKEWILWIQVLTSKQNDKLFDRDDKLIHFKQQQCSIEALIQDWEIMIIIIIEIYHHLIYIYITLSTLLDNCFKITQYSETINLQHIIKKFIRKNTQLVFNFAHVNKVLHKVSHFTYTPVVRFIMFHNVFVNFLNSNLTVWVCCRPLI